MSTNGNGNGIAKARLDRRLVIYPPLAVILGLFVYGFVTGGPALQEKIVGLLGSSLDIIVFAALASKAIGAVSGRIGKLTIGDGAPEAPPTLGNTKSS